MRILCSLVTLATVVAAAGMDRWAALSMIESGDCDTARGRAGEFSRFQIKPVEWRRIASSPEFKRSLGGARPTDPAAALTVAKKIMAARCAEFERAHARAPTDFEFYVLWNAPAKVDHPSAAVTARARRFCNLVARPEARARPGGKVTVVSMAA